MGHFRCRLQDDTAIRSCVTQTSHFTKELKRSRVLDLDSTAV